MGLIENIGVKGRLEEEFDFDIVDEFIDHFDIITSHLDLVITALENYKSKEKVDELFRFFHNIKSATAYLKLENIHYLAEIAEEVMEALRKSIDNLSVEVVDWLFLVSEQFRVWLEELEEDADEFSKLNADILNVPEIIWQLENS